MTYDLSKKLEELVLDDFKGVPRASSWIPRHFDIKKIAAYTNLIKNPKMLDAGCGNGFISYLFALEGLDVLGVDLGLKDDSKFWRKDVPGLKLRKNDIYSGDLYKERNIVFNSWMPQGEDWSGCFKYAKPAPSIIFYVKSQSTGLQPQMPVNINPNQIDTYTTPLGFIEVDRWKTFGNDGFILSNDNGIKEKTCDVIVQVKRDVWKSRWKKFELTKNSNIPFNAVQYNWEKELPSN